ncbi:hypothetical protein J6590_079021 [Homalodisca vitripennis]|nr:hypothetical protein J6590_079021 [Homalodisca vitripennis]
MELEAGTNTKLVAQTVAYERVDSPDTTTTLSVMCLSTADHHVLPVKGNTVHAVFAFNFGITNVAMPKSFEAPLKTH